MSLAEVNVPARRNRPQSRPSDGDRALQRPALDDLISRVFGLRPSEPDGAGDAEISPRNFDVAFHALKRGAESLDELQARCSQLQSDLAASAERHRQDLEHARHETALWQKLAAELKGKVEWSQSQLTEAERTSTVQEDRIAAESRRADAAERRTEAFERVAMAFHDGIMTVFREGEQTGN